MGSAFMSRASFIAAPLEDADGCSRNLLSRADLLVPARGFMGHRRGSQVVNYHQTEARHTSTSRVEKLHNTVAVLRTYLRTSEVCAHCIRQPSFSGT